MPTPPAQWRQVADQVRPKLPKLAALLDEAAITRLIGALEQNDKWSVQRARYMTLEPRPCAMISP